MALEAEEKVVALQATVKAQEPAVKFVERYVEAEGAQPIRAVAKLVKMKEQNFVQWMIDHRVMYRLQGKLTPFAEHITAGRFEVKTGVAREGEEKEHAFCQSRFTPAGIAWITKKMDKAERAEGA